ncbi:phage transcriptional regulator AlpA [Burkholderia pseudomallei]|nr:phage transcriptional regulator AlpA [Burkholderia pseudomallei]
MSAVVELGEKALISLWDLARAIARVKRPVAAEGTIGIDCVEMKYWDTGIPHYSTESADSFPVDVSTSVSGKKTLWNSSELNNEERRRLAELLPKLPELRCPMDEVQREQFLTAYRELVDGRWHWEPLLLTEADVARQQAAQQELQFDQINALRDGFESGKLVVCDARHVPIKRITFTSECFVSKRTAIEYLEGIGVPYQMASQAHEGRQTSTKNEAAALLKVAQRGDVSKAEMGRQHARRPMWTIERYQELAEYRRTHTADACAARFNICDRTVRKRLKVWKTHPQNPAYMSQVMAGGPKCEGAGRPPSQALS